MIVKQYKILDKRTGLYWRPPLWKKKPKVYTRIGDAKSAINSIMSTADFSSQHEIAALARCVLIEEVMEVTSTNEIPFFDVLKESTIADKMLKQLTAMEIVKIQNEIKRENTKR